MSVAKRYSKGTLLKRGGNKREGLGKELTSQLTKAQCDRLLYATKEAIATGRPYNRVITIIWGKFGARNEDTRKLTENYLKLMRNWANRQGFHISYIAVQEWGEINGGHFHALIHIPPQILPAMKDKRLSNRWAKQVLGVTKAPTISMLDQLYPPQSQESYGGWYDKKLQKNLHYMMKCSPAHLEQELGMIGWSDAIWGQECPCYGKRIFVSQRQRRK